MTIIGFSFRKIVAEKGETTATKVNISNNVSLKKVEEANIPVGKGNQKALRFTYEYTTKYEPNTGSMLIEGDVLYLAAEDVVEKTVKNWKKTKKVDKEILAPVLNTVLNKCSIKGILLSQDLNLPSPMQMPRVTVK
jgi:hypothetical protein